MKQLQAIVITLLTFSVIACGSDPHDVSEENFEITINRILARNPLCVTSTNFRSLGYGQSFELPWTYNPRKKDIMGRTDAKISVFDTFTDIGLLNKEEIPIDNKSIFESNDFRYSLTEQGKESFRDGGFCYGINQVVEITNYTEPTEQNGSKAVQVTYTYFEKITNDWIIDSPFKYAMDSVEKSQENPEQDSQILILTKKGWFSLWELR